MTESSSESVTARSAAYQTAGLYDPAAAGAADRLELLEYLHTAGVSISWMQTIYERAGLTGLLEASIGTDGTSHEHRVLSPHLTVQEVAEQAGVALEMVEEYRALVGLPRVAFDVACLPPETVFDLKALQLGEEIFGIECRDFFRAMGAAAASVVQAAVALLVDHHAAKLSEGPGGELATLKANMAASTAQPLIPEVLAHMLTLHFEADYARRLSEAETWGAKSRETAVGFVDLVDSTSWAGDCPAEAHRAATADFEMASWKAAGRHGGRIVKYIGDEAMFVAEDAVAAVRIALDLCRFAADHSVLPPARGAVGLGPVTRRGGDYFGPVVNMVSRATKAAAPGQVVVSVPVAEGLTPDLSCVDLGEFAFKGLANPVHLYGIGPGRDEVEI